MFCGSRGDAGEFPKRLTISNPQERTRVFDMVDNFDIIKPLLKFNDHQDFYFLQLLLRKKDGNNVPAGSDNQRRLVRDYHITSTKMLDELKDDIIRHCNETNARAYIRLNKRNYKTIAMAYAQETLEKARKGEQFGNTYNEINSVIGRFPEGSKEDKTWLVDIDDFGPESSKVKVVMSIIRNYCQPYDDEKNKKIVAVIPTRSGTHLITKPFDLQAFNKFKQVDLTNDGEVAVLHDNPTILYAP